jgi:hypothetical protein
MSDLDAMKTMLAKSLHSHPDKDLIPGQFKGYSLTERRTPEGGVTLTINCQRHWGGKGSAVEMEFDADGNLTDTYTGDHGKVPHAG